MRLGQLGVPHSGADLAACRAAALAQQAGRAGRQRQQRQRRVQRLRRLLVRRGCLLVAAAQVAALVRHPQRHLARPPLIHLRLAAAEAAAARRRLPGLLLLLAPLGGLAPIAHALRPALPLQLLLLLLQWAALRRAGPPRAATAPGLRRAAGVAAGVQVALLVQQQGARLAVRLLQSIREGRQQVALHHTQSYIHNSPFIYMKAYT